MFPVIFQIGPVTVYSYGLMMAAAVIVCAILLSRDAKPFGISSDTVHDMIFWVILSGIIGARLFYIILNWDWFANDPSEIWKLQNGGLAFQGGFILGGITAVAYLKKKRLPFWLMADLMAPYLALGHAIGRIGCFLNGCCYGKEVSWGVYFPVHDAHLHPTQLYDTVELFIVFLVLRHFRAATSVPGRTLALYLILASLQRFLNEFFRADPVSVWMGLRLFQIVSLVIMVFGVALFVRLSRKGPGEGAR